MSLITRFREYKAHYLRLSALLAWAGRNLSEGEVVWVTLTGIERTYSVRSPGVLQGGEKETAVVIVCEPQRFPVHNANNAQWKLIFRSLKIEVWENAGRFTTDLPLRFGVSEIQKMSLLSAARRSAQYFLVTGNVLPDTALAPEINELQKQLVSIDVAFWIDGQLRGSMIVTDTPCIQAVNKATLRALRDSRFKPIEKEELGRAYIEITLWNDLLIPLTSPEIEQENIYFDKLYMAESGGKRGWYLPEVFNCVRFRTLSDFLKSLAVTKGGFVVTGATFFIGEVVDFTEISPGGSITSILGAMPASHHSENVVLLELQNAAAAAADWLISLQNEEGFIPPMFDPVQRSTSLATSWPRLAFCAWALAAYAQARDEEKYRSAADLLAKYIEKYIFTLQLTESERKLTICYMGLTAHVLGNSLLIRKCVSLVEKANSLPYNPILYLQCANFLSQEEEGRMQAKIFFERAFLAWQKECAQGSDISLAAYAELLTLSRTLGDESKESEISSWYKKLQHVDGSFPDTTMSAFSYTRGTGKIFEAMATRPALFKEELIRSARWLQSMQYTTATRYFLPENVHPFVCGALRHDMGNTQAWIDAVGHFILGTARLRNETNGLSVSNTAH